MKNLIHRKESLVLTAIEIINELSIQGLSTREIAKRQGITDGAMFKHFNNKKELMIAILDYYSQYDQDIIESIRIKKFSPKDAIKYFVKSYVEYYENYSAITAITLSYDVLASDPNLAKKIKDIFYIRREFLIENIEEAKKLEIIRRDIDSENFADIIVGTTRNTVLRWRFSDYSFSIKKEVLETLDIILDAFNK